MWWPTPGEAARSKTDQPALDIRAKSVSSLMHHSFSHDGIERAAAEQTHRADKGTSRVVTEDMTEIELGNRTRPIVALPRSPVPSKTLEKPRVDPRSTGQSLSVIRLDDVIGVDQADDLRSRVGIAARRDACACLVPARVDMDKANALATTEYSSTGVDAGSEVLLSITITRNWGSRRLGRSIA